MAVSILPIGTYFKTDEHGFVINPVGGSHLSPAFKVIIDKVNQWYSNIYTNQLHSIYLRGSLARGTFKEGVSDIDFVALAYDQHSHWLPIPNVEEVNSSLRKSSSINADFELMVSGYSNDLCSSYPALAMILKTQSLCVFGESVIDTLPDYRPGQEMMIHYKWLEKDITDFLASKGNQLRDSKSIMKTIVRSGFELVMEREMLYTLDLYPALISFGKYYPEKKHYMEEILYFYLNPSERIQHQKRLVDSFGNWLLDEFERTLM